MRRNKRVIALLQILALTLSLLIGATVGGISQADESNSSASLEINYDVDATGDSASGVPLSVFSGRLGEWGNVSYSHYTASGLTLRSTSDGEMLYTIVEGPNRDTRNVFYISIDGRPGGFTFMGRPNVHYVVANGYLYRVLNAMSEYRSEYAAPAQVGATTAANQLRVFTYMPEWFGADDDPDRDAQRLKRVSMEYFRTWTGMRLHLNQIGNPDPADVRISWRGMDGGVASIDDNTLYGTRRGAPVHLPTNTGAMMAVEASFEAYRPEGVYFPTEDFGIFFNPLRGGGSNLQSSEEPDCTCPPGEPCIASLIHTQPDGSPLIITDGPIDGQWYGYAYITWRSLEPEPDVFSWDTVRMYTKGDYPVVGPNMDQYQCARGFLVTRALEEYARLGIYVQLRFVMDYPFGSPFGYWYGDNYIGGIFDNSPLGGQESHTELAMINLRNERIADIPTWLIERLREEPNRPNLVCDDNIPNRPDFNPGLLDPEHPDFIVGDDLYIRMRNPGTPVDPENPTDEELAQQNFYMWAQRFLTGYFHCTIPNPLGGADLRTCPNGCVPYRRPVGLAASPNAVQASHGWHPSFFWGPEGTWYLTPPPQISGGVGLGPRYEHHLLIEYHERAIHALAGEIARPESVWNAVANVQFGSLGRWGEWHNWPAEHTGQFPDSALAYQYVRHYVEAFADNDNIQLGMRYPNWIATRYNFGAFNDQTGHNNVWNYINAYAGQNLNVTNPADGSPGHNSGVTGISSGNDNANMGPWNRNDAHLTTGFANAASFLNAIRNPTHWMHAWVGGEYGDVSVPTNFFWQYVQFDVSRQGDLHRAAMHDYGRDDSRVWGNANGNNRVHIMNTLDSFRWSHISNLAPRGPNAGRTNATTGDMQRAHKNNDAAYDNMGYQFFIEEVEVVDGVLESGESADIRMVVNNIGVAPFYRDWPFEVSFIDENGNVAATQVIEDIDIRTWMPRHRAMNNARPAPGSVCPITGVHYRSVAELSVVGNLFIPAHDGRNEFVFTVDVPDSLSETAEYTMAVAILDPILLDMNPGIWFHNDSNRDDRRVLLAPFIVNEVVEVTEITVTFNPTGGTVAKASRVVTIGETFGGAFPMPTRPGYAFEGWFTAPEGGSRILGTNLVTKTENITLYARWRLGGSIVITFNPNGGIVLQTQRTVQTGADNFGGAFPMPSRLGYIFEGWFTRGGTRILGTSRVNLTEDTELIARWRSECSIVVTFNPNGGVVSPTSRTVSTGDANLGGAFPRPQRLGYIFTGWFTVPAATGGTRVLGTNPVTQTTNFTVYARWVPSDTIVVTFNPAGGTVSPTSRIVTKGDIHGGAFPMPTHPGYVFAGWFTAETGGARVIGTNPVTHTADFTLYARWTTPTMAVKIDILETP